MGGGAEEGTKRMLFPRSSKRGKGLVRLERRRPSGVVEEYLNKTGGSSMRYSENQVMNNG